MVSRVELVGKGFNRGRNVSIVGYAMAVLRVDDRYRVVLDREVREFLKVEPGDKVLAIPSSEGVLMISLKGKSFNTSLPGFRYKERDHEASRFLFKKT